MTDWRLPLTAVLLAALAAPAARPSALCVTSDTPCREYSTVPVIFQGVVERITPIDDYDEPPFGSGPAQLVRVRIERVWKGLKDAAAVDLVTLGAPGRRWVEDEVAFEINQRYVIWARPSGTGATLRTSMCSRTRPLKDAAEDVEFLDSLSRPASGGFVYGKVWFRERVVYSSVETGGLNEATVVLSGNSVRREARTDADGNYRFTGLTAGTYDVRVVLPKHLAAARIDYADAHAPAQELPVRATVVIDGPRDCAKADFWTQSSGSISGFASMASGQPIEGVVVLAATVGEIRRTDAERAKGRPSYLFAGKAVTGADGSFEFTNMPPGQYVVGVSVEHTAAADHPYPRTFYPGVAALEEATILELQRGQPLHIGNFALPSPLAQIVVHGNVIGMDGRPAARARVVAVNNHGATTASMNTGADGRFRLTLYSGYRYRLRAELRNDKGAIVGETAIQLDAPGDDDSPLRLELKPPAAK